MAYFAKLNSNNIVIQVVAVANSVITDENGIEQEQIGINFLKDTYKEPLSKWVKTSYNTRNNKHYSNGKLSIDQSKTFRGNYAGINYLWDETNQIFYPSQKPYPSWVLNLSIADWDAPIPRPTDGLPYKWSEEDQNWIGLSTQTFE